MDHVTIQSHQMSRNFDFVGGESYKYYDKNVFSGYRDRNDSQNDWNLSILMSAKQYRGYERQAWQKARHDEYGTGRLLPYAGGSGRQRRAALRGPFRRRSSKSPYCALNGQSAAALKSCIIHMMIDIFLTQGNPR